ncbi:hypothetical protein R0J92_23280, partial [Tritonibacter sp. SIMBA_163]
LLYRSGFSQRKTDDDTSRLVATRERRSRQEVEACGGGNSNAPTHNRRRGEGPRAEQIGQAFALYCRKHGLNRDVRSLTSEHFRPPPRHG